MINNALPGKGRSARGRADDFFRYPWFIFAFTGHKYPAYQPADQAGLHRTGPPWRADVIKLSPARIRFKILKYFILGVINVLVRAKSTGAGRYEKPLLENTQYGLGRQQIAKQAVSGAFAPRPH